MRQALWSSTTRPRMRRGVSLTEALISSGILALIISGVAAVARASNQQFSRSSASINAETDASLAMQTMERELREAIRFTQPNTSEISAVLPLVTSNGDYDRFTEGNTVRWYRNGDSLVRQATGGNPFTVATGVSNLSFTLGSGSVAVQMTATSQSGSFSRTSTLRTTVRLRNMDTAL